MSITPKKHFIEAILTNQTLSEEQKSELIAEMMEEFQNNYPELQNHATKEDIKKLDLKVEELRKEVNEIKLEIQKVRNEGKDNELKLIKEIESNRAEIKNVELKLIKDIEKTRLDLTKEIESKRAEIKNVELKLTKEIGSIKTETIKWVSGLIIGQTFAIAGIVAGIFKFFMH